MIATPTSALSISAHPDDTEFGCGATLAKWASDGCTVHMLVCTDGSKGTWNPDANIAALVKTRQSEQRAAHEILGEGRGEVRFLNKVDGELDSGVDSRREVARVIRELRPEVILGHDPWKRYRLHPDHRHAGQLTIDGVVAARDRHFFPELGLEPHRPAALLLFEADEPDYVESVDGFEKQKIDALLAHTSQHESTMGFTAVDGQSGIAQFSETVIAELVKAADGSDFAYGEAFKLLDEL